jgi:hypothetical protein
MASLPPPGTLRPLPSPFPKPYNFYGFNQLSGVSQERLRYSRVMSRVTKWVAQLMQGS